MCVWQGPERPQCHRRLRYTNHRGDAPDAGSGGGTNFGCLPFEQHLGLGKLTKVDALEIRWPGGSWQRIDSLTANRIIQITEGQAVSEDVDSGAPRA